MVDNSSDTMDTNVIMETNVSVAAVVPVTDVETSSELYEPLKEIFFDFVRQASADSLEKKSSFVQFGQIRKQLHLKSFVAGVGYQKILPWIAEYVKNFTNPNITRLMACFYLMVVKKLEIGEEKGRDDGTLETGLECVVCLEQMEKGYRCKVCKHSVVCKTCYDVLCGHASSTRDCVLCRGLNVYVLALNVNLISIERTEEYKRNNNPLRLAQLKGDVLDLMLDKLSFWSAFQTLNIVEHAKQYIAKLEDKFKDNRLVIEFYRILKDLIKI